MCELFPLKTLYVNFMQNCPEFVKIHKNCMSRYNGDKATFIVI